MCAAPSKPSFLETLLAPISGAAGLRLEKARLEAFLAAVPGEYCGFAPDGSTVYSDKFLELLDLKHIETLHDIQNALAPSDAAVLEGMMDRLETEHKTFSMQANNAADTRILKISGSHGQDLDGTDHFIILWIEDVTEDQKAQQKAGRLRDEMDAEIRKLQNILDLLPLPVWMRRNDLTLDWCNQAYGRLTGVSPAEAVIQQKELTPSSQDGLSPKDLARTARQDHARQSQSATYIAGGKRMRLQIEESYIEAGDQTIGIARDISREEELEKDLDRNVAAYKGLLEHLNAAVALFSQDQTLEFFNTAYAQLWGLEESWLNGKPKLGDILEKLRESRRLPEQADFRSYKQDWLNMFTRLIDPHEDMMYLPDDSALRVMSIPHPMGGLMMIFEDVTSRLNLESSYNTLIAVQRETLDNLSEGVAVYGSDGRLKLWNPSFAELWGLHPEEIENEPHISKIVHKMLQLLSPDSITEEDLIAQGLNRSIQEGRIRKNDGTLLEHTSVPLPDGGVLVSYYDVTDSVQVEEALREKNAALEAAEQLKTDFLANVSYQLRTPLSSIIGFAEILDNQYFGELNEKQREYTEGIQQAGDRLVGLIDDILDLASFEAGYMEINKEPVIVQDMLQALHALTQDWAGKHGLSTKLQCADNLGTLHADPKRIKQALLNLIRNAIHHTPLGGTITISGAKNPETGALQLSIHDTGPGIAEKDQARIFEPFERAQDTKTGNKPTASKGHRNAGLGLTVVRNIVDLHDGDIHLDSAPEKGSVFTLSFAQKE